MQIGCTPTPDQTNRFTLTINAHVSEGFIKIHGQDCTAEFTVPSTELKKVIGALRQSWPASPQEEPLVDSWLGRIP